MTKRPAHIDDGLGIRMGEEILNAKAVRLFRRGSAALKFERGGSLETASGR